MTVVNVNNIVWLQQQEENSIDHIITDPPYLINFMGAGWDKKNSPAGDPEFWKECLRVVKPGGYCLAFGHSRQHHRVMCAMEDAGWEVRDCLMWLYAQGFPKSQDIGKRITKKTGAPSEWSGWGNALKPAYEPIIMARKPFKGSLTNNVLKYGLGAINIDACRIGSEEVTVNKLEEWSGFGQKEKPAYESTKQVGRFPANVMLDEEAGNLLGDASRFFFCPKVGKKERNLGCADLPDKSWFKPGLGGSVAEDGFSNKNGQGTVRGVSKNNHPTVKPVALMEWLTKLVSKEGQTILDPFAGSGSTGMACVKLNRNFIGLEIDNNYAEIAKRRIEYVSNEENE